jgi:LacI family transcriptional regulator
VADAVRFIRRHAHEAIGVGDLLEVVPFSRRSLELRFTRALGRSPAAEIRRARVERAMELLAGTDLSIARVAVASGFNYTEVMNRVFRREVGLTPTMYRRRFLGP